MCQRAAQDLALQHRREYAFGNHTEPRATQLNLLSSEEMAGLSCPCSVSSSAGNFTGKGARDFTNYSRTLLNIQTRILTESWKMMSWCGFIHRIYTSRNYTKIAILLQKGQRLEAYWSADTPSVV